MVFGSVCSGIEAASVAWKPLGWRCAFMSEIDPFPRAVLAHHYPETPLHGDFTTIHAGQYAPIDLLVGGTPCQDFSIAGLRAGITGDRGNLTLEFLKLADRLRPKWIVWENVPGVMSIDGGRALGAFLGGLAKLGYGFAYCVRDAQFFNLAQRRQRVFVVGYLGDWRRAAAVLFERESLSGNPAPRREAGSGATVGTLGSTSPGGGWRVGADEAAAGQLIPQAFGGNNQSGPIDVATALNAHGGPHGRQDFESETFIAHTLRAEGFDASEDGTGRGVPLVATPILEAGARTGKSTDDPRAGIGIGEPGDPMFTLQAGKQHAIAFSSKDHGADAGEISPTLRAMGHGDSHANAGGQVAVAMNLRGREGGAMPELDDVASLRAASGGSSRSYVAASHVRRLTPRECERLQGFPDDYTLVTVRGKPAADGPRYKALGNSMAVPVMRWIGRRIQLVDGL